MFPPKCLHRCVRLDVLKMEHFVAYPTNLIPRSLFSQSSCWLILSLCSCSRQKLIYDAFLSSSASADQKTLSLLPLHTFRFSLSGLQQGQCPSLKIFKYIVQFLYYLSEFFLSALKRPGSSLVSYIYLPWIMSFTDMATTSQSLGATKSGSLGRIHTVFCLFIYFNFERLQHAKSQFPDQGSNLCPLHWDHRILTPGPPGKSCMLCFKY